MLRLCPRMRCSLGRAIAMTLDYVLGGAVTAFLIIYLTYALICPERF
jgi:K+-transporting ATPase KdpF subunit